MIFGGLQKTTLIDYPGKIACVVYTLGCTFRCPFCYSSEIVLPEKIKKQPKISEKEVFDFLKERKGLIEGVVFCGGEPTINSELPDFIKKIKNLGYLVKLDTNGSNPEMLEKLIKEKLINYVAMDIKAPLGLKSQFSIPNFQKSDYEKAAGVKFDIEKVKKSIGMIKNSGIDYEFRTTVVPSIHTREDIIQLARDISPAKKYYLQNFRAEKTLDPKFEKIRPYSKEFLLEIQEIISPFFEICQVR